MPFCRCDNEPDQPWRFNRGSYVWGYGADFRVRHQTTWTEDLTQLTHNAHCIRGSNNYVIVQVAAFHFGSQVVHANAVSASGQSSFSCRALGEDSYTYSLASTVWQHSCATNDLVGFTWVNTQVYSNVNGLAELDSRQLGQQGSSVYKVVGLACFDFAGDSLWRLVSLAITHPPR